MLGRFGLVLQSDFQKSQSVVVLEGTELEEPAQRDVREALTHAIYVFRRRLGTAANILRGGPPRIAVL